MHPTELIESFELLGNAFGLGKLGSDKLDLLYRLPVDLAQMVVEFKLYARKRIVRLAVILKISLSHSAETAYVLAGLIGERRSG